METQATASGETMEDVLRVKSLCEGCGACCLTQESPPGYVAVLSGVYSDPEDEDVQRVAVLPKQARQELDDYRARLRVPLAGTAQGEVEGPCIWLDLGTRRCRWYEHRPSICREFDPGSDECHGWRDLYQIADLS